MARIIPKAKSFKRQAVTVVVLLSLLGAYYALIVPAQTSYFTNRYFRLLAAAGDNLKEIIRNLDTGLANAAASGEKAPAPWLRRSHILDSVALIPDLTQTDVTLGKDPSPATGLRLRMVADNRPSTLLLDYATGDVRIIARTDLARMIEPFLSRAEFDDVLLVNTDGEVLYQLAASPLVLARLVVPTDRSFETNLVNYAGSDYRLFAQPVRIPATSAGGTNASAQDWVLCGLVREDHFRERAWAVDYRVIAVFIFGALLLIVSWPLLNLLAGGLKGGLRVGEKLLLGLSAVFVTAVLTLLVLDRYAYRTVKDQVDAKLEKFADSISAHLETELNEVHSQLGRLNAKWSGSGDHADYTNRINLLAHPELMGSDLENEPYPWLRMVFWTDPNGTQVGKWTIKNRNTPFIPVSSRAYFRNIVDGRAWTRRASEGLTRFSLEPIYSLNTGENLAIYATQMSNRLDGISAIDLRLLSLVNPIVPGGYGFAVIDGEGKVLFHADEKRNLRENFFVECGEHARLRAAVHGRTAHSFNAPYFQIPHRMLTTPLKDLPWSLVVFRDLERLQVAQIDIVSMAGLLFLIHTVLALAVLSALHFAAVRPGSRWLWPQREALDTYWWLTHLLFLMAVVLGALALLHPGNWLTLVVALAAPSTGLILARTALEREWRAPRGFEMPARLLRWINYRHGYVGAMGMLLVLLSITPTLAFFRIAFHKETELLVKQTQLKLANDLQTRADRIRTEVKGGKSPDGILLRPLVVTNAQAFIARRLTSRLDFYDFNDQWSVHGSPLPSRADTGINLRTSFNDLLRRVRPHYNKLDAESAGLLQDAAADGSWQWTRESPGLVLQKSGFRSGIEDSDSTLRIESYLPRLPFPRPIWLAAFAILFAVPFLITQVGANRVLMLRMDPPSVYRREWGPGKYLLLGPPHANKAAWLTPTLFTALARATKPPFLLIDLRRAADRQWLDAARQDDLFKDTGLPIVVDHFDYNLTDPEFNKVKFRFLQQFAHDERRSVILVSNVHPLHFPVAADRVKGSENKPKAAANEKQKRIDTLAAYKRIYKENEFDEPLEPLSPEVTYHRAHAHYRSIWATCSPKEQEILHQVALGRLVSSDQFEIRTLLARHLVELDPELQLMPDDAFRRFVLTHYQPELDEETEESTSIWQAAKGPAITVLMILAIFLFVTQRALWDYTIGLVPVLIAGLGALAQVINLVQKQKLTRATAED